MNNLFPFLGCGGLCVRGFGLLLAVLLGVTLSACGGGGSGDGAVDTAGAGEVVIALTDAEGDFATYTVDVLSLALTNAKGVVVETLPINTRIDFARYTDLSEFLTAASVPSGMYVKGSMLVDYRNADIRVEDAGGGAVRVGNIVDKEGNTIEKQLFKVGLEGRDQLLIAPGVAAHLTLDFDLEASNSVVFDVHGVPTVSVSPHLLAAVNAGHNKVHRLRGPLKQVDEAANTFEVYLRPFRHRIREHHRHLGILDVSADRDTVYDIDGITYRGEDGLAVLALQSPYTAVSVVGDVYPDPRRFVARQVYAGSSVPGGDMDVVRGSVVGRVGDRVTVKGATLFRADGSVVFNDTVSVQLADSTRVSKQLSTEPATPLEISVGQRVSVFGTMTNPTVGAMELDAANGYVRMELSSLQATRVEVTDIAQQPVPFTVNLSAINGRSPQLFDFSGTGPDSGSDADPENYEIDTGALNVSSIASGAPLAIRGHVTPFRQAPEDFVAWTIIDRSAPFNE